MKINWENIKKNTIDVDLKDVREDKFIVVDINRTHTNTYLICSCDNSFKLSVLSQGAFTDKIFRTFDERANHILDICREYNIKVIVLDACGLGVGLCNSLKVILPSDIKIVDTFEMMKLKNEEQARIVSILNNDIYDIKFNKSTIQTVKDLESLEMNQHNSRTFFTNKTSIINCLIKSVAYVEMIKKNKNKVKKTFVGSLSECVSFINQDIEGIKKNIIKSMEEDNVSAHNRWLQALREALSVKKEYDWKLMYSVYETDGHKEIAIWEQDSECNIRGKITWRINDGNIDDNPYYECDLKKKGLNDFENDFENILNSKTKFLIDTSIYPRACGKTTSLKSKMLNDKNIILLVPSINKCPYINELNDRGLKNQYLVINDVEDLRGLNLFGKTIICEEGFSVYDIFKLINMGLNIQCALVNGVE